VSAAGEARRVYEAALRSKWDAYRHTTVTPVDNRLDRFIKRSDGAIAAAYAGDVTRLVDCLRGRKKLAKADRVAFVAFVETKVPWRWPRWRWLADALTDQTDESFDALADFIEKIGRRRGGQRDVGVHTAARLAEVLMTVGLYRDAAIKRACEIVGEEAGAPIDLKRVRGLLNQPTIRRRVF
jgi:hypothetical protein